MASRSQSETFSTQASCKLCPELGRSLHHQRLETHQPILIIEQRSVKLDQKLEHLVPTLVLTTKQRSFWVTTEDTAKPVHECLVGLGVKDELLDLAWAIQEGKEDALIRDGVHIDAGVETG